MTTTDEACLPSASTSADSAAPVRSPDYHDRVSALTRAYQQTVDTIMTGRYGPRWHSRGDLPDDAYTTELIFSQWLSDLLDHIDATAELPQADRNE